MALAPPINMSIGRGDNAPAFAWTMPFAVAGSDFALTVTTAGVTTTYSVTGGSLILDTSANAVTWPLNVVQSASLAYAQSYTLQRVVMGGEVRTYAWGILYGENGPVLPSNVTVPSTGPQGPSGPPGEQGSPPTDAQVAAAVAAWFAAHPVLPPYPGTPGVLDFSDPANSGLLAAIGPFGAPFVPGASGTLDFSSSANSGLIAALIPVGS